MSKALIFYFWAMSFILFPYASFTDEPDSSTTIVGNSESYEILHFSTNGTAPVNDETLVSTGQLPIVTITLILLTGFLTGYIIKDAVKIGAIILGIKQIRQQKNEPMHNTEDGLINNEKAVPKGNPNECADKLLDENFQEFLVLKADLIKNAEGQNAIA